MKTETRDEYIARTAFMDWQPYGEEFQPHPQVAQKVNPDGSYRPFWGDTMLFYVRDAAAFAAVREKLYETGIPLSGRLNPKQFHMTLHDLDHTMGCDGRWDATKQRAESILAALEPGTVRLTPGSAFPMMNTSIVLGYRPAAEPDCRRLMDWCSAFEPLFSYGQPTFHITLAYFLPETAGRMPMAALKSALDRVNQTTLPELEFSKEELLYQRFYDMNCYFG